MLHRSLLRIQSKVSIGVGAVISPYGLVFSIIPTVVAPESLISMGYSL